MDRDKFYFYVTEKKKKKQKMNQIAYSLCVKFLMVVKGNFSLYANQKTNEDVYNYETVYNF